MAESPPPAARRPEWQDTCCSTRGRQRTGVRFRAKKSVRGTATTWRREGSRLPGWREGESVPSPAAADVGGISPTGGARILVAQLRNHGDGERPTPIQHFGYAGRRDQGQVFSSTCQPPGVVTMMSSLVSWLRSPVRK